MDKRARHIWEFVETLLGPVVYLAFLGLTYLLSSITCALSRGNDPAITDPSAFVVWSVVALAALALSALVKVAADGSRQIGSQRAGESEDLFLGMTTLLLAGLSALAVIWTALPAATVPPGC